MSSIFSKNIHPNIQKELYVRHKALENRRGKYVPGTGVHFSEMMSRTTYAILVTDYVNKDLINKGIASGEDFEDGNNLIRTKFGFTEDGLGSYRNTTGGSDTGIRPICGIKSVELEFLNANGVRKATVNWNAPSLEAVDEYSDFLRAGTRVALQFGWNYETDRFADETFISYTNKIEVDQDIYKNPFEKINASFGNMDALGGSILNFSSKLRDDGGFDCTTEIMGFGISYMQDTDSQKADSTFKVSRQVREAIQSVKGPDFKSIVSDAADFLDNIGIDRKQFGGAYGKATDERFVRAIAYNDLDHAILNLDTIVGEFIEKNKKEVENRADEKRVIDESNTQNYDNTYGAQAFDPVTGELLMVEIEKENRTQSGELAEDVQVTTEIESIRTGPLGFAGGSNFNTVTTTETRTNQGFFVEETGNFFEVNNVRFIDRQSNDLGGDTFTVGDSSDYYVRWGWFEDNILTKYTAVVNDANETLNEFRSITVGRGSVSGRVTRESNLIAYNENMIPENFSEVFWASYKNKFSDINIEDLSKLTKSYMGLLEGLNRVILERGREFRKEDNKGRIRNMFVSVSTIQEKYLGISNSQLGMQDEEGFLYAKPAVTNVRSGTTKIMNLLSKSLYNVPNLIIENNIFGAGITDQTLDGIVSNKTYSDSLINSTVTSDLGPNLSGQLTENDDNFNGMYLFPSYEKGSIVKNQNFELNVPDKLASVAFLNSGGNLLTKKTHDSEENKFSILAEHHGYPANSYLPAAFEKRNWGVDDANPERNFKNQNNNYNYYGGLIEPGKWRKIPLSSRSPNEKNKVGEVLGPKEIVEGQFYYADGELKIGVRVNNIVEVKTGFSGDLDDSTSGQTIRQVETRVDLKSADASATYDIDENQSINWLEAIRLKPQALEMFRKLFLNENEGTSVDIERPIRWASLSLDVDGIGGLRPRNMFNCSYLPEIYNREIRDDNNNYGPSYYFSITGVTQKIDDSGWTTSIDSLMNLNYQAYRHLPESDLHTTKNAISSLSRNFQQSRKQTLTERLNSILEPISLAKTKFDTYMRESQDYVELQELAGTGSATPYSDSYEKWKRKREVKQRNKNAKEELELAGKMSNYINNLDIEPIGRDYILSTQANYTDVDWGLELVQQVQGNAKAPKDIRKVEFKPIQEEFPLTPVTVGSDASNFVFETNAYRRVMSEDNVDTELNTTTIPPGFVNSRGLPKGELVETDAQTERGLTESGLVAAGAALTAEQLESSGLPPEAYITQEQIQIITGVPSDAAPENKPVDEETAEVVDQSEGKNIFSQILGLFNKKTKEEVEVKNSPPPFAKEVRKDTILRINALLKELGLDSANELYTEIENPKITEVNIQDIGDARERGSISQKRRYRVFGFSGKVKGVKFNDGNGAKIEELPITSVNEITVETGATGESLLNQIQQRVELVFKYEAQEYTLKKYKETIS